MVKINQLDENLNIEGKRVLLRVDFNVPINDGSITENSRIEKVLPTIKFLIKKKAKIIINDSNELYQLENRLVFAQ